MPIISLTGNAEAEVATLLTDIIHLYIQGNPNLTDVYVCRSGAAVANFGQYANPVATLIISSTEFNTLRDSFQAQPQQSITLRYESANAPPNQNVERFVYTATIINFQLGAMNPLMVASSSRLTALGEFSKALRSAGFVLSSGCVVAIAASS